MFLKRVQNSTKLNVISTNIMTLDVAWIRYYTPDANEKRKQDQNAHLITNLNNDMGQVKRVNQVVEWKDMKLSHIGEAVITKFY